MFGFWKIDFVPIQLIKPPYIYKLFTLNLVFLGKIILQYFINSFYYLYCFRVAFQGTLFTDIYNSLQWLLVTIEQEISGHDKTYMLKTCSNSFTAVNAHTALRFSMYLSQISLRSGSSFSTLFILSGPPWKIHTLRW